MRRNATGDAMVKDFGDLREVVLRDAGVAPQSGEARKHLVAEVVVHDGDDGVALLELHRRIHIGGPVGVRVQLHVSREDRVKPYQDQRLPRVWSGGVRQAQCA